MIKAILFDADGVLIVGESFKDHLENELHISPSMTSTFFKGPFKQCLIGKADLKETITPFLPQWGWTKTAEEFISLWFDVEQHPNKPLMQYIGKLRDQGIRCYVATNQEKYRVQYIKDYMNLKPLFDGFFASNEIGYCKPDAEFFQYALDKIGLHPGEVLFWDDMQSHIVAAKAMGINAEVYTSFEEFERKMKSYL